MSTTYEQAIEQVTGPDSLFATSEAEVGGRTYTVFTHTPPALRTLFDMARPRGDRTFLVYEDERWTFAEVMEKIDALAASLVERYAIIKLTGPSPVWMAGKLLTRTPPSSYTVWSSTL